MAASYRDITKAGEWVKERATERVDTEYNREKTDLFRSMMEAEDHKHGQKFGLKVLWIESMLLLIAGTLWAGHFANVPRIFVYTDDFCRIPRPQP